MKWSTEIPSTEGAYWVKSGKDGKATVSVFNSYRIEFLTSQFKSAQERKMDQFPIFAAAARQATNEEDRTAIFDAYKNLSLDRFTTYYQGPIVPNNEYE